MLTIDFDILDVGPGHLALDAGCGEGRHSFGFIMRGAEVFSMDRDIEALRKARYILSQEIKQDKLPEGAACHMHTGDALRLPFTDCTFDRIICSEVMEHVKDDKLACRELARVLKTGGRIAVTVPTFFSEMLYDALTYEYFTSPGGHIRKYLPQKLAGIMDGSGLCIYYIDFKHSFHTIYWALRCIVGLHLEHHPFARGYRNFLNMGNNSVFIKKLERFFDNFFPKSIVFYAYKK